MTALAQSTDWVDSVAWDQAVTQYANIFSPNVQGILPLHVAAGQRFIDLGVYANFVPTGGSDFGVGVFVDGAWSQNLAPTANGLQTLTVRLDGAAHDVDIVAPNRIRNQPATATGTFVYSYGSNANVRTVTAPTRRFVEYGDSIPSGSFATPNAQLSWTGRTRLTYPGRLSLEAWGGRRFNDDVTGVNGGLANLDALTARIVALATQGGAVTTTDIWISIGVNDYLNGTMTAAAFATQMASLFDKIHAALPGARAFGQSLLITGQESTVINGETPPTFRTAMVTACTGRAWVTPIVGPNLMAVGGLDADGIHPTTAGHAAIADGSGAFAGSTNVRAAVGF